VIHAVRVVCNKRRGPALLAPAAALLAALAAVQAAAATAADGQSATTDPARVGIWKAAVPPAAMHGEFDNDDPIGLTAGVRIKADCSINWTDPDAGKLYCFSSATSLVVFLDAPRAYLERARAQWLRMTEDTR
jgi:hypothetical protein